MYLGKRINIKKIKSQKLKSNPFLLKDFLQKKNITLKNLYIDQLFFFPNFQLYPIMSTLEAIRRSTTNSGIGAFFQLVFFSEMSHI